LLWDRWSDVLRLYVLRCLFGVVVMLVCEVEHSLRWEVNIGSELWSLDRNDFIILLHHLNVQSSVFVPLQTTLLYGCNGTQVIASQRKNFRSPTLSKLEM
jgi:hypothetical protein